MAWGKNSSSLAGVLLCWSVNNFWKRQSTETILQGGCGHPGEEIGVFLYVLVFFWGSYCTAYCTALLISSTCTHTDTHRTDFVKAQPPAGRNPVSTTVFRGECAAGPLMGFSPQILSYLEVHSRHKAESRAWQRMVVIYHQRTGSKLPPPLSKSNNKISYYKHLLILKGLYTKPRPAYIMQNETHINRWLLWQIQQKGRQ